jgi:hypothetical protein
LRELAGFETRDRWESSRGRRIPRRFERNLLSNYQKHLQTTEIYENYEEHPIERQSISRSVQEEPASPGKGDDALLFLLIRRIDQTSLILVIIRVAIVRRRDDKISPTEISSPAIISTCRRERPREKPRDREREREREKEREREGQDACTQSSAEKLDRRGDS